MPNFDGTGPFGQGPFTGRSEGFCVAKRDDNGKNRWYGFFGREMYADKFLTNMQTNYRKEAMNMPAGDRTGPQGLGPMTGRAAGFCAGYGRPGYLNPTPGYVPNYYSGAYPPAYGPGPGFGFSPALYGGFGCGRRRGGRRGRRFW